MITSSILSVLFAYIFAGGCMYSVYARLEQENVKHPVWLVFLTLFLIPAILIGLVLVAVFAIGLVLSEAILGSLFQEKSVK